MFAYTQMPQAMNASHNVANQMKSLNGVNIDYDANGNRAVDSRLRYTWNARNQLASYNSADGSQTGQFLYDAFGRRISKTINGRTTQYLYDGHTPIQEQNGSGAVTANLLTGPGIDEYLTRTESGGATFSYLPDALGSTAALSEKNGYLSTIYRYEPYGKSAALGASSGNSFQYTGRENDGLLYYYRARYYDPGTGRFISEDPIALAAGPNVYAYVGEPAELHRP